VGAQIVGEGTYDVEWILTDSRSLCFPETTMFFALRTERGDGHRYVRDLYERGVRVFVVSSLQKDLHGAIQLLVQDTLCALQRLAERHRESFSIPVIGITGSNGKTVVKEWLYQMLSPDMTVTRSPRSYNSQIGVPLSVWALNDKSEVAIFEAGISMPGEMSSIQRMIQPTIGVFTGLGPAHQENFQTMEQKRVEKMLLFKDCPIVFEADEVVEDALERDKELCARVCRHLGMSEDVIQERLSRLEPVAMRLEVKQGRHSCTLINDTYNSDEVALFISSGVEDGGSSTAATSPINMYTIAQQVPMMVDVRENIDTVPVSMLVHNSYRTEEVVFSFYLSQNWNKKCYFCDALTGARYRILDGLLLKMEMPINHENRYYIEGPDRVSNSDITTSITHPNIQEEDSHIWAYSPEQGKMVVGSNDIFKTITIYDLSGRVIVHKTLDLQFNSTSISVPAGIYIVEAIMRDNSKKFTKTIVR
jgi:hypothetical protein